MAIAVKGWSTASRVAALPTRLVGLFLAATHNRTSGPEKAALDGDHETDICEFSKGYGIFHRSKIYVYGWY